MQSSPSDQSSGFNPGESSFGNILSRNTSAGGSGTGYHDPLTPTTDIAGRSSETWQDQNMTADEEDYYSANDAAMTDGHSSSCSADDMEVEGQALDFYPGETAGQLTDNNLMATSNVLTLGSVTTTQVVSLPSTVSIRFDSPNFPVLMEQMVAANGWE